MSDTIIAGGTESPATDFGGELSELESRADLESLEGLQQQRRALVDANASLIARYGSFGLHDDYRKSFVETQKVKARMELSKGDAKITEGRIDAEAYGGEAYAAFLDNALNEKVEYLRVQTQIDELNERIRSRELAILAYNSEMRLGR